MVASIDTEGGRLESGVSNLAEIAAVSHGDPSSYFIDTVVPAGRMGTVSPQCAMQTSDHVLSNFWGFLRREASVNVLGGDQVRILLVGHNVLAADIRLIGKLPYDLKGRVFHVDTLTIVRGQTSPLDASATDKRRNAQAKVYKRLFGDNPVRMHGALADARANLAIAKHEKFLFDIINKPFIIKKAWIDVEEEPMGEF